MTSITLLTGQRLIICLLIKKFELLQHQPSSRNDWALLELPFASYENCYYANEICIEPTDHVVDLGVTLQHDLSFGIHIYDIVKKPETDYLGF